MAGWAMRIVLGMGLLLAALGTAAASDPPPGALQSAPVRSGGAAAASVDGVVQAVRQTALAAQVAGAVVALDVQAGDRVRAGQVLLRLDARAAEQTAAAGAAQVQAARAAQEEAARELERQRQLFAQHYISRAALDRAEAQSKATQAEAAALLASAGATRTQSGFYVLKAPYAGVVSDVAVVLGDMALPGRPLLTLYDPKALRVSAPVPQSAAPLGDGGSLRIELPGMAGGDAIVPTAWQLLPTVDPATHSLELRLDLPAGTAATPGMFARVRLPGPAATAGRLFVPARAVVRRAELSGVYVIGADGQPRLRLVRLGRADGDSVEVLAGVSAGERVALDPQAAARVR